MRNFKIAQPTTLKQVTSLLTGKQDKYFVMSGGTDLLEEIKSNILEPEVIVDLYSVPDLAYIKKEKNIIRIGALTSLVTLAENAVIKNDYPGLRQAAMSIATPQLRNMGTVGGNLCQRPRCWYYRDAQVKCRKKGGSRCFATQGRNKYHAIFGGGICNMVFPSDLAPMLICLEAKAVISTPRGDKTVPLADFYTLPRINIKRENILKQNEILKEIQITLPKKEDRSTYFKIKERESWDFAVVSVAAKATTSGDSIRSIKLTAGGVAPIPWKLDKAEAKLKGKKVTENLIKQAASAVSEAAKPLAENHYKKDLLETALKKAIRALM